MGKQPPQTFPRSGCIDDSAPIFGSSCCATKPSRPEKSNEIGRPEEDRAAAPEEDEADIKELLLIGAGPHGHAIMLRLLEPDPDFLSDKERHQRAEHTNHMRPVHDVIKHVKNLSRGERATLRSKSRRSRKKSQGDSETPHPPPHLHLREVKKSVLVVDSHGGWMQAWKDNFESLRIPRLRSLMNAHTDPFDHRSLEYYAEAKGRGDELVTLKCLSQRDKNFNGPYQVCCLNHSAHLYEHDIIIRSLSIISYLATQNFRYQALRFSTASVTCFPRHTASKTWFVLALFYRLIQPNRMANPMNQYSRYKFRLASKSLM